MGQIFTTIYPEASWSSKWKRDNFLVLRNFLNMAERQKMFEAVKKAKQHKWSVQTPTSNNSTVINKNRTQAILYLNKYMLNDDMKSGGGGVELEVYDWFQHNTKLLSPVIEPIVDRFMIDYCGIKNNEYRIQRIMYMEIPPGEPEQQIHQDGDIGDGAWFLFLPLNSWTKEMGGTIFYYDSIVGHLRNVGMDSSKQQGFIQQPNKGFLKGNKFEALYNSARFYQPLNLGDISAHTSTTLHHGAENKSNKTRTGVFIVIQTDLNKQEALKIEWMDELKWFPHGRLPAICQSMKATIPRNPEEWEKRDSGGSDPYDNMPVVNDVHPDMFKA